MSTIVTLDLNNFDTDDLIAELEDREYHVMMPGETDENSESLENMHDEIHTLYLNFLALYKNNNREFEKSLKKFFEDTIDVRII